MEAEAEVEPQPDIGGAGDSDREKTEIKVKQHGITKLRNFIAPRRVELAMWVTRIIAVLCSFFTIFPVLGNWYIFYNRTLIALATTSALRLYQRIPRPITLSKEFVGRLLMEDCCHYLSYSLIFMYLGPVTFSLVPVFLVSSLHVVSFALQMMEAVKGPECRYSFVSMLGSFLYSWTMQTGWVLKMASTAEVLLMPLLIVHVIKGSISILAPFVYYRFLTLRYASRRNPYTRTVFYEMRMATEGFICSGKCPGLIARMARVIINVLCKLAPPSPPS